ncbi:ABC transporter substrate-binding protein [Notoacmeibacter sp. MSK16QG-6]|uniref:ABC transporter substrate-binding protein n=1 Tax=Notoacmeibacter sp. MSK16QG-6 TaxID=2957982 RepID=UPI00209DCE22|nr:ABC transporter substrate-binding protein [Notoacmeibacter sp. MSK16QG-6]MCP1200659.1 ABC transporter substrate-binding protein [Notoacmeibacter sp. MSK16QG-6]
MNVLKRLAAAMAAGILTIGAGAAQAEDLPKLRAAMLATGTVNWEITTIKENGLDTANGFELVVQDYADNGATRIALAGGEADVVVADWIWAASQRADGKDYVFIPYSRAVGGLVVKDDSGIETLQDLAGKKIGIAGGPVDKSWLILRAYAEKKYGMDLKGETEQVFGAPPLIFKSALQGETAGAINFWHFLAKMKAKGMHELVSTLDAAAELGLDPDTPLLGYVLKEDYVDAHPDVAKGLFAASRAAKELLETDDAAWEALRPKMNAGDDAEFTALRDGFREGIPSGNPVDEAAADRFLKIMADLGGEKLVGKATTLPEGLFLTFE